jgi:hypothetical protein
MGAKPTVNMDTAIVKAAVDVAHAQGKPVFTHPQNRPGVDNALAGGVNILAHTIPTEGQYTPEELLRMKQHQVALIPTSTLWTTVTQDAATGDILVQAGVQQLKAHFSEGGMGMDTGLSSIDGLRGILVSLCEDRKTCGLPPYLHRRRFC